jgi:hypothetical protein
LLALSFHLVVGGEMHELIVGQFLPQLAHGLA